jgi:hypothetical protein
VPETRSTSPPLYKILRCWSPVPPTTGAAFAWVVWHSITMGRRVRGAGTMGEDQKRSDLFVLTEVKLKTEITQYRSGPFSTPSSRFRHCRVGANSILAQSIISSARIKRTTRRCSSPIDRRRAYRPVLKVDLFVNLRPLGGILATN